MIKKMLTILLLFSILFNFNISIAADFELPEPSYEYYVYDEANIIESDVEEHIINKNKNLYSKYGAQVVVVTVNSLQESSIEEFANELFREWGIGSSEEDNGVLLLVAPNEKRLRIEVGYGLEGALPDGKAGRIRDEYLNPNFRNGDYSKGILLAFDNITNEIENEYLGINQEDNIEENKPGEQSNGFSTLQKIFIGLLIIILIFIDFRFFGGFLTYMIIRSIGRGRGGSGRGGSGRGGGGSSGGGGASGGW
ncbi:TPM domain-containing protein [Senegalia massiliensis]|uniref:TPM domain-containing protein n=1 Tax=Senegalia massiliensis TaxID=1720316 RepID=A0A845QXN4_9CLOT|nr:TPM domain-containing protein [Senegalia massiliensis]NBI05912.1 TPM domain-containing protein [Senegalia massiliensis]